MSVFKEEVVPIGMPGLPAAEAKGLEINQVRVMGPHGSFFHGRSYPTQGCFLRIHTRALPMWVPQATLEMDAS